KAGGRSTRKRTRFLEKWWPDAGQPGSRAAKVAKSAKLADLNADQAHLFEALRQWRLDLAQEASKPAYTVLTDASLIEIAQQRPTTIGALASVRGVGASKLDQFGAGILRVVADN